LHWDYDFSILLNGFSILVNFEQKCYVLDEITKAIGRGFAVDLVLLDFAKAFDKVSHKKLIQKLEAYGINEVLVRWIWFSFE